MKNSTYPIAGHASQSWPWSHSKLGSLLGRLRIAKEHVAVSTLAYTIISLEIIWTRIFAGHFRYTFAFLVLSLAMLGMGGGALMLRLIPTWRNIKYIGPGMLITVGLALLGPLLVVYWNIQFTTIFVKWSMAFQFIGVLLLLGATYFVAGIVMAIFFVTYREELSRLYMFDLVGAAAGALGAVILMNSVGTPAASVLSLLPLLISVWLMARLKCRMIAVVLIGVCLLLAPRNRLWLPSENNDLTEQHIHSHWDSMGLVNVYNVDDYRAITLDNVAAMAVRSFDGDVQKLQIQPYSYWFDMKPLMERMGPDVSFLSVGAAGGADVMMALKNNAKAIYAVEVNPYINQMLRNGLLTQYTGGMYQLPRVHVVTEDARAFVRRYKNRFDIISSMSSNTLSASGDGAFAMAENYLFTVEAFEDYLRALTPRGVFVIEHRVYGPRLVTQALMALKNCGIADPNRHIAVYEMAERHTTFIMVSKQALTRDAIEHSFSASYLSRGPRLLEAYPRPQTGIKVDYKTLIEKGWRKLAPESSIDLSPATDDRPYIAQLGLMKNVNRDMFHDSAVLESNGFPLAKLIIMMVLGVACILILPLTIIPYWRRGPKITLGGWMYFFAIGCAFMSIEVVLMQVYCLFVGYSAYTMAVLLFALLVGAGWGSRLARHFKPAIPFVAIIGWIILQLTVFRGLMNHWEGLPLTMRMFVTFLLILPLGFFMGMPFPKGSARVDSLIDWAMAVNGSASVIGGTGIMLVCFTYGLSAALGVGAALYGLALGLVLRPGLWVKGS